MIKNSGPRNVYRSARCYWSNSIAIADVFHAISIYSRNVFGTADYRLRFSDVKTKIVKYLPRGFLGFALMSISTLPIN